VPLPFVNRCFFYYAAKIIFKMLAYNIGKVKIKLYVHRWLFAGLKLANKKSLGVTYIVSLHKWFTSAEYSTQRSPSPNEGSPEAL
jgi:hypothetical protein